MADPDNEFPQSMFLQTLKDSPRYYRTPQKRKFIRETNKTSDIVGAQPKLIWLENNKPEHFSTDDIDGAKPKKKKLIVRGRIEKLTKTYNKKKGGLANSKRLVNPLVPDYKLPTFEEPKIETPKFIKDSMASDVDGCKPSKYYKWETRDLYNVTDIDGATRKLKNWKTRETNKLSDIDGTKKIDRRRKTDLTNPLQPKYQIHGREVKDSQRNKPKALHKHGCHPFFSLSTTDIDGATFRDKREILHRHPSHPFFSLSTADIDGATSGTTKRERGSGNKTYESGGLISSRTNRTSDITTGRTTGRTVDSIQSYGRTAEYTDTIQRTGRISESTCNTARTIQSTARFKYFPRL